MLLLEASLEPGLCGTRAGCCDRLREPPGAGARLQSWDPTKARVVSQTLPTPSPRDSPACGEVQGATGPVENRSKNERSFGLVLEILLPVRTCLLGGYVYLEFYSYKKDAENHET